MVINACFRVVGGWRQPTSVWCRSCYRSTEEVLSRAAISMKSCSRTASTVSSTLASAASPTRPTTAGPSTAELTSPRTPHWCQTRPGSRWLGGNTSTSSCRHSAVWWATPIKCALLKDWSSMRRFMPKFAPSPATDCWSRTDAINTCQRDRTSACVRRSVCVPVWVGCLLERIMFIFFSAWQW